jgi:hypothetical protein
VGGLSDRTAIAGAAPRPRKRNRHRHTRRAERGLRRRRRLYGSRHGRAATAPAHAHLRPAPARKRPRADRPGAQMRGLANPIFVSPDSMRNRTVNRAPCAHRNSSANIRSLRLKPVPDRDADTRCLAVKRSLHQWVPAWGRRTIEMTANGAVDRAARPSGADSSAAGFAPRGRALQRKSPGGRPWDRVAGCGYGLGQPAAVLSSSLSPVRVCLGARRRLGSRPRARR